MCVCGGWGGIPGGGGGGGSLHLTVHYVAYGKTLMHCASKIVKPDALCPTNSYPLMHFVPQLSPYALCPTDS